MWQNFHRQYRHVWIASGDNFLNDFRSRNLLAFTAQHRGKELTICHFTKPRPLIDALPLSDWCKRGKISNADLSASGKIVNTRPLMKEMKNQETRKSREGFKSSSWCNLYLESPHTLTICLNSESRQNSDF